MTTVSKSEGAVKPQVATVNLSQAAAAYIEAGLWPIPLNHEGKPLVKVKEMTKPDAATVADWTFQTDQCGWPWQGIGLLCDERSGVLALDIDKPELFTEEHGAIVGGLVNKTPHGGWHVFVKQPGGPVGSPVMPWGCIKARNNFVTVAPSLHRKDALPYEWFSLQDPSECPEWVRQAVAVVEKGSSQKGKDKDAVSETPKGDFSDAAFWHKAVRRFERLSGEETHDRNDRLYKLAMWAGGLGDEVLARRLAVAAQRVGLPEDEAINTINSGWKNGVAKPIERKPAAWSEYEPPQNKKEVIEFVNADGGLQPQLDELKETGCCTAPIVPQEVGVNEAWNRAFNWLDRWHFVTKVGGKPVVACINPNPKAVEPLTFMKFDDFQKYHSNWTLHYPVFKSSVKKDKEGNITEAEVHWEIESIKPVKAWLNSEERRQHTQVEMYPPGADKIDPFAFNLWKGFGVHPKAGDFPETRKFLKEIICDNNEDAFAYLERWMARAVQEPAKPAEVAVVMRGTEGIGKGTFNRIMRAIFDGYSYHSSNIKDFTGDFTSHLLGKVYWFLDEAFWGGDKKSEGELKRLITEETISIEPKFLPKFEIINRSKIVMASNEKWVVPAGTDARRFFVLDVNPSKKGDFAYWDKLNDDIKAELPALMHHLMNLDLKDFNHRKPPMTKGLDEQKVESLKGFPRWFFERLCDNEIEWKLDGNTQTKKFGQPIAKSDLKRAYDGDAKGYKATVKDVADFMDELEIDDKRSSDGTGKAGPRVWRLPDLEEARARFVKFAGLTPTFEWPAE